MPRSLALLCTIATFPMLACGALLGLDDTHVVQDAVSATAPQVTAMTPDTDRVGVDVDVAISATFDAPMDAASLATAFRLALDGEPVAGVVDYDADRRRATFRPARRLALGAAYAATITADARSDEGVAMAAERIWTFTVRSGAWTGPQDVGELLDAKDVGVAMNANGDALLVVLATDGLVARRWANGTWDLDQQIIGHAALSTVRVALDGEGHGLVVAQPGSGNLAVFRNHPDGAWEAAPALRSAGIANYAVVADPVRGFHVAWVDDTFALVTSRLDGRTPTVVEPASATPQKPRLEMGLDGAAALVWLSGRTGQYIVRASRTFDGATWLSPADLSAAFFDAPREIRVAVGGDGAATVVWYLDGNHQSRGDKEAVWMREASRGVGGAPERLFADGVASDVAMNARGDTVAVWSTVSEGAYKVAGARRMAGGAWSAPKMLGDACEHFAPGLFELRVEMDRFGNALAAWYCQTPRRSIRRSTLAGEAWSSPQTESMQGDHLHMAVDGRGGALLCWLDDVATKKQARCDAFR